MELSSIKSLGLIVFIGSLSGSAHADLPWGQFPSVRTIQDEDEMLVRRGDAKRPQPKLEDEINGLKDKIEDTVKLVARKRNLECLKDPCLIQAFPIMYNKPNSGFFAGARAQLVDLRREDPSLFEIDGSFVRSDTEQVNTFVSIDFPKIESVPFNPRVRSSISYNSSSENRYYGSGLASRDAVSDDDDVARYQSDRKMILASFLIPVLEKQNDERLGVFFALKTLNDRIRPWNQKKSSLMDAQSVTGRRGGAGTDFSFGAIMDSRDHELQTRHGSSFEVAFQGTTESTSDFHFARATSVGRRYDSWSNITIASRITADVLVGDPPIWELSGVGGFDPIENVGGSLLMPGYGGGRFHERNKAIFNIESRFYQRPRRIFGQHCQIILTPAALGVGQLGELSALSYSMQAQFLFNQSFLVLMTAAISAQGSRLGLTFNQEF